MTSAGELWATGDLDLLFHGTPIAVVPWYPAGRLKAGDADERAAIEVTLGQPPVLTEVDPREMLASQAWLVRRHAAYYLTGEWERTGTTSADMVSAANRYPIVAVGASGRMRIVTGHHRTFAALVQGRLLLARLAAVDRSVDRVTAVTPLIRLLRERAGSDAERAIDFLEGARGTLVRSEDEAENALTQLGLDEEQVADRLHMATTGRVLGGR